MHGALMGGESMRSVAMLALLGLAVGLAGCSKKRDSAGPPPSPSAQAQRQAEAGPMTGAVTEEQFKRMHQLRGKQAPPAQGQMITIDGTQAYLSLPKDPAPVPGIVVIQEWWGLNDHIKHWSDRLAALGYAALAVDLYNGQVATTPEQAMQYMKQVNAQQAIDKLRKGHDFLQTDPRVKAPRTAVIGWCFGGKYSLELAIAEPALDAAVVYYGHVTTDPQQLAKIKAPVLAVFGTRDDSIPQAHVDAFEQALQQANVPHRVLRYDAEHAFANPSGPRYSQQAAEQAWQQTQQFLAEHLKR